jgi:hypothetical protein
MHTSNDDDDGKMTMFVSGSNKNKILGKALPTLNQGHVLCGMYDLPLQIKDVKCGGMNTMILTQDNCLYTAGSTMFNVEHPAEKENELFRKVEWNGPVIQQMEVGGYYTMLLCGEYFMC